MVKCWYCEWYHFHRLSNLRNRKILDRRMERWFEQCRRKLRWLHWLLLRLSRDENYIIYNINNVTEYKYNSTKVLRCESWEVHYFNMFGLIPVWQNFLPNPRLFCREVCEVTLVKTLITVLTPISWSYFVTRASTYDLIPCHTSGEHEQTSIMTTTSRSHFGGGSSLQSQVQSWFLISAVHSSSGGQYGGSAGSKERWLRWNWGEICVGMKWG